MFQAVVAPDALSDFFLRMQNFFQRLKSFTEVSLDEKVKDRMVVFMAEVLTTLANLTKHIKQRRLTNYMKIITPLLEARPLSSAERRPSKSSDDKERSIQTAVGRLDKLIQDEAKLPRPVALPQPSGDDMDEKRSYSLVSPTLHVMDGSNVHTQDALCWDASSRGSLHPISCKSTPCARLLREQLGGFSKTIPTNDGRPVVPCCGSVECVSTLLPL
ncbi:hypothetical protein BGW80DRAFT_354468 [Lactifluus volemus]|nr:hypothetical protein BGW80DRAFT_354468 [Lactifluus volemus]